MGGSGGGGTNDNGQYGAQGGAGGGALMIASSTKIVFDPQNKPTPSGSIWATGGNGGGRRCGGSGGAVRLVANNVTLQNPNNGGVIDVRANGGSYCKAGSGPSSGILRIETNDNRFNAGYLLGPSINSVPFSLNLPTQLQPNITVSKINGVTFNANPFSFPDTTINTNTPVPVIITATNVPLASTVTLYILSDTAANQTISVTLTGTDQASTATVNVTFPSGGSRGFVKAVFH